MQKGGVTFNNKKDFLMYYHTSIRNVGLFTSVALAAISAGRAFSKSNGKYGFKNFYALIIYLLGLSFLIMGIQMLRLFIEDVYQARDQLRNESLTEWLIIPYIALTINIALIIVAAGSFVSKLITIL